MLMLHAPLTCVLSSLKMVVPKNSTWHRSKMLDRPVHGGQVEAGLDSSQIERQMAPGMEGLDMLAARRYTAAAVVLRT